LSAFIRFHRRRTSRGKNGVSRRRHRSGGAASDYSSGTSSSATMLMILIKGFTAGPAVSLYGSPTVSPVTAA
jgi:hypothetical protein